ncbi:nucleotide exchange factor sil1 [Gnomoniopsis smithogilvyi]|uniref:Nucleotide exchange factor sil1 n=1 Tax=Gnomoniopsis smithogilvyi TaxID=1191159 RepID=A0A9W8Z0X4_9PEZI|nr:nucleotide exchange factor sil1 [Gnomoniopsis smithogilvyi]
MRGLRNPERLAASSATGLIILLIFALLTVGGSATEPNQDITCSSENPGDCYPKVFQATDEFQVIREGQDVPHGLHVRLDVTTGKKEAKLNDPNEKDPVLEGLPIDSSMVVVESEQGSEDVPSVPKGAPAYEPVGKIKAPQTENQAFYDSLTVLKTLSLDDRPIDAALSILKDIAHDIYYGLKVAEDANAVKELLCMMSSQDLFAKTIDDEAVTQAGDAAYIIGSALQNNQKALFEVEKSWADISKTKCAGTDRTFSDLVFNSLVPDTPPSDEAARSEGKQLSLTKAKSSALRGLIKSPVIRDDFLANGGMAQILKILTLERPELVADQQKLANLVMDNFLDEDMGATLGVWPRAGDVDHDWDYKLKDVAKLHKADKGHWSTELWKRLQEQRRISEAAKGTRKHEDL